MRAIKRSLSAVIAFCFVLNTVYADLALAQNSNAYNLAISSKFDKLIGLQSQDMGRIEAITRLNLAEALKNGKGKFDITAVIRSADNYRDSVFKTQIRFREHKELPNGYYAVQCKTREGDLVRGAGWYWVVFAKDWKNDSPIYTYTETEFERFVASGAFTKAPPVRSSGDKKDRAHTKEIARYVRHEMGIDRLIMRDKDNKKEGQTPVPAPAASASAINAEQPGASADKPAASIFAGMRSSNPAERKRVIEELKTGRKDLADEVDAYLASLPISGKKIMAAAKETGRPVLALNIDNGELSTLQIRSMMEAALESNSYIMFEVGPGALKTYDEAKPTLPEYCSRIAKELYLKYGRPVVYAVHLDHNQIDKKKFKEDQGKALQEAVDRVRKALRGGFTSIATDTSTLTDEDIKRDQCASDEEYLEKRLRDVIWTGIGIMRAAHSEAESLGTVFGSEGEVGDVGKDISTFEEAKYYYEKVRDGLADAGIDAKTGPWLDIIAAQLGTSHGYDFTGNDLLKPYEGGKITVEQYAKEGKKGVVLERAHEIAERFERELGIKVGVALHGFSGTPLEVAPSFISTGIAKVNINTDWQAVTWKVLEAYFPELYKKCFDLSREAAVKTLAGKPSERLQKLIGLPMAESRNRVIFGKDGAPGLRNLFRGKEGWALVNEIVTTLKRTDVKMIVADEQAADDVLKVRLTAKPCASDDPSGMTALEAIHKLTKDRTLALMKSLELSGMADRVQTTDRASELRLQEWQIKSMEQAAQAPAAPVAEEPTDGASQDDASLKSAGNSIETEIAIAATLAAETGRTIPTYMDNRYTLLMTEQFYSSGELDAHRAVYGDRFELDKVSGQTPEQFIANVLAKAAGKESRTVTLIPDDMPAPLLEKLTAAGIRFVRTNVTALQRARADKDPDRAKFQLDTYVTMLLVRHITKDMAKDSAAYRTLGFYLKSHFNIEGIAIDDYIEAIVNNEVVKLIKGYLSYRPIAPYDARKEYEGVSRALISA